MKFIQNIILKSTTSFILVFCISSTLKAGVTGKISGQITDESTGEPLVGVNVQVVGTSLGAATDISGYFNILGVAPGNVSVRASAIGYATYEISDIRILIDQTSRVDFSLTQEAVEGELVTVMAQRNVVREDVATSVASMSGDEVNDLPLSSVSEAVGLQAGIEGDMVIRGGGADEALFLVNDVTLRDARNNQPISSVALSAIQELSVERGGFNAEYGQVRSGIINVVTKEGSKDLYTGSATIKYSSPAPKHYGVSPFDVNSMWLRPYLDDEVAWEGTASGVWDPYTQKQYPRFEGWNTVSERLFSDDDPSNDLTPFAAQRLFMWEHRKRPVLDQPDHNIDAGFGGPIPILGPKLGDLRFFSSFRQEREMLLIPLGRDDYISEDLMLQLTSDINPSMKLKLSTMVGRNSNIAQNGTERAYSTHYMRSPFDIANRIYGSRQHDDSRLFSNSYYSLADVDHKMYSGELTHTLSPKTFYEISIHHVSRSYETGPISLRDSSIVNEITEGLSVDEAPFGWSPLPDVGITGMFFGGHTATSRDSSKVSSTTFKFDITSQLNRSNLVKSGLEIVISDLDLDYGVVNVVFPSSNNYVKMSQKPIRGAFYLQDKLESKGFVLNAGLRLDYHNGNTEWVNLQPFSNEWKQYNSTKFDSDSTYGAKPVESMISLSPRLAISHPITTTSKLFFNYGHFKQLPTYEQMYRLGRNSGGAMRNYGNPELMMSKTVSYELGFDQLVLDRFLIQLAGFYHDISDQQSFGTYYSADGNVIFTSANNNSYEDIRGFELTAKKTAGAWWTGFANYTYQVNTAGRFGKSQIYENPSEQRSYDRDTKQLYQSRPIPQPYARASLTFRTPNDFGPTLLSLKPLGGWASSLLVFWKAGYYAYAHQVYPGASENFPTLLKYRDWTDFTLRITKTIPIKNASITFMGEVQNLFNIKRLSMAGFYDFEDRLSYFESLHLPESEAYNNIVGNDLIGTWRDDGIEYQPIEIVGGSIEELGSNDVNEIAIYYEKATERYMQLTGDEWTEVHANVMKKILNDRAYIDMPNQTSFNFLNPRQLFFAIRVSF
jgi:outer membrane receptor protein involved in Fe transport|tara:strand:+ start:6680 stop:9859 length:3180 start_codon:yes stop_codon:yes gene_type:complete